VDGLGLMWFSKCQLPLYCYFILHNFDLKVDAVASAFSDSWLTEWRIRGRESFTLSLERFLEASIEHFTLGRTQSHVSPKPGRRTEQANLYLGFPWSQINIYSYERYREELLKIKLTIAGTVSRNLQISKYSC